jgi:hypothetical protein
MNPSLTLASPTCCPHAAVRDKQDLEHRHQRRCCMFLPAWVDRQSPASQQRAGDTGAMWRIAPCQQQRQQRPCTRRSLAASLCWSSSADPAASLPSAPLQGRPDLSGRRRAATRTCPAALRPRNAQPATGPRRAAIRVSSGPHPPPAPPRSTSPCHDKHFTQHHDVLFAPLPPARARYARPSAACRPSAPS